MFRATALVALLLGFSLHAVGEKPLAVLTASDGRQNDQFGRTTSANNDTVVVGAVSGRAYVFVKPAGGWVDMTQTAELSVAGGGSLGWVVAISGDTVAVGGGTNGLGKNAVHVFVKPASGWADMTQSAELTASDGVAQDRFGWAVSASGAIAVVGAQNSEKAYVFVKPGGGWTSMTQTAELTPSGGAGDFGASVAVLGSTVAVGAPAGGDGNEGAVYVFMKPASGWTSMTETAELTPSTGHESAFGNFVGIATSTVVATSRTVYPPREVGSAFVFVKPPSGWANMTETADLTAANQHEIKTGRGFSSVAITGGIIIVGADAIQGKRRGALDTYLKPPSGWSTTSTPDAEWFEGRQGFPGAVSTDAHVIVTSVQAGPNYPNGAVLLFKKPH